MFGMVRYIRNLMRFVADLLIYEEILLLICVFQVKKPQAQARSKKK